MPQDATSVLHLPANGELISMAPPSLGLCLPSVPLSLRSGLADLVSYDTTDSGLVDCSEGRLSMFCSRLALLASAIMLSRPCPGCAD